MVDFSSDSSSEAFSRGLAATGVSGRSIFSQPEEPARLDQATVDTFTTIANKYGVPADVLLGLAEKDSGFNEFNRSRGPGSKVRGIINVTDEEVARGEYNPYDTAQNVEAAARKLRSYMQAGASVEEAVMAHAGGPDRSKWSPEVASYAQDVMARSARLSETYYPGMAPRVAETETKIDPKTGKPVELTTDEIRKIYGIDDPGRPGIGQQLGEDVQRGFANLGNIGRGLKGMAQAAVGDEAGAKATLDEYVKREYLNARENSAVIGSYKNIRNDWQNFFGDAGRYAIEAVGENAAMFLPAIATGGIGASIGRAITERATARFIEDQVAKGLTREAAEALAAKAVDRGITMGAAAGAAPSTMGMETGSIGGDIYKETGQIRPGVAAAGGAVAGALDLVEPVMAIKKAFGPAVSEPVKDMVIKAIVKRVGVEGAKQFAIEAGTEGLQTIVEQASTRAVDGKPLFTPELLDDVVDSALKGGIGGGVMGVGSQIIEEVRRRPPEEKVDTTTRDPSAINAAVVAPLRAQESLAASAGEPRDATAMGAAGRAPAAAGRVLSESADAARDPSTMREPVLEASVTAAPEGVSPAASTEAIKEIAAEAPGRQTAADLRDIESAPKPATARPGGQGPLSRVLETGAPSVAPLATAAGQRVVLTDENGSIPGIVVGQDAEGILFKDDTGFEQLIENDLITSGKVSIAPADAAPPPAPAAADPFALTPEQRQAEEDYYGGQTTAVATPITENSDLAAQAAATISTEPPPAPAARSLSEMSEEELRARMKYIAEQGKATGSNQRLLAAARKEVERAIDALKATQSGAAPAKTPLPTAEQVSSDMRAAGEQARATYDEGKDQRAAQKARSDEALEKLKAGINEMRAETERLFGSPEAPTVATFKTAKGSTYQVHDDGTTTRNKAARNDPGHEGDSGIKKRSARTIYVDTREQAAALSSAGISDTTGKGFHVVIRNGKATLISWNAQGNGWGATPDSKNIPFTEAPAVGKHPVELWGPGNVDGLGDEVVYSGQHAGNKIVEIKGQDDKSLQKPVAPPPEPIEDKTGWKEPKRPDEATMKRLLTDYSMNTPKAMQAKIDNFGLNDTHETYEMPDKGDGVKRFGVREKAAPQSEISPPAPQAVEIPAAPAPKTEGEVSPKAEDATGKETLQVQEPVAPPAQESAPKAEADKPKPFNEYGHYKGQSVYVIDNFGNNKFDGVVAGKAQNGGVLVDEPGKLGSRLIDNPMRVIEKKDAAEPVAPIKQPSTTELSGNSGELDGGRSFTDRVLATRFNGAPAEVGPDGRAWRIKAENGGYIALRMPNKPGAPPTYFRPAQGEAPWSMEEAAQRAANGGAPASPAATEAPATMPNATEAPTAETQTGKPDAKDGEVKGFYVTLRRDDGRTAWLAGPYRTKEEADAAVKRAVDLAYEVDPKTHFDAYGTASRTANKWDDLPKGRLNDKMEAAQEPPTAAEAPAPAPATDQIPDTGKKAAKPKRDAKRRAEKKGKAEPAQPKRGEVGMMLSSGEIVTTTTGRETTPFPKIGARGDTKRVEQWLMDNAIAEAKARGDDFNLRGFEANRDKPSQADKDSAEMYLFDPAMNQPVPKPFLKPLGAGAQAEAPTGPAPEWAEKHAEAVGGDVVWHDGEIALIRGYSILNGRPVYSGAQGTSRTTQDIATYSGELFTNRQLDKLRAARAQAIAKDEAAHAANPEGPFKTAETKFAASPNVPANLAAYAKGLLDMLGIEGRVYLTTIDDARNGEKFNGPYAAINSAGLKATEAGSARMISNGDFYIAVRMHPRRTRNLEIIAHEIGHILEKQAWQNADPATRDAIMKEFRAWLETAKKGTKKELVQSLRAHTAGKTTPLTNPDIPATKLSPYWTSFSEWFADNVSRWAVSSEKPLTLVDQFFDRIGKALRRLYASISGRKYLPASEMARWLDARGPSMIAPVAAPEAISKPAEPVAQEDDDKKTRAKQEKETEKALAERKAEGDAWLKSQFDTIGAKIDDKLAVIRANQEAFLKTKGMTFDDLQNIPDNERDAFQKEYDAWFKKNGKKLEKAQVGSTIGATQEPSGSLNERWKNLVENSLEPGEDKDQRSPNALHKLIGRVGEDKFKTWERWGHYIGSWHLADKKGEEVLKWMEDNLPTKNNNDDGLPGATRLMTGVGDLDYWTRAKEELEKRLKDFNIYVDRLEQMASDVEGLGGDQEKIDATRSLAADMKRKVAENERKIDSGIALAEKQEKNKKAEKETEELAKYQPADMNELAKKPSPAAIVDWFQATYKGNDVWTNGHILDLNGEPHLSGWRDRINETRSLSKIQADKIVPQSQGKLAQVIGVYNGEAGAAKKGLVFIESKNGITALNRSYFQYFASKYKGAEFRVHDAEDQSFVSVYHDGKRVGVISPVVFKDLEKLKKARASFSGVATPSTQGDPNKSEKQPSPVKKTSDESLDRYWKNASESGRIPKPVYAVVYDGSGERHPEGYISYWSVNKKDALIELDKMGLEGFSVQKIDPPSSTSQTPPAATEQAPPTKSDNPPSQQATTTIQDAGEKIGGARKDKWKERGLNLDDLKDMSSSEAAHLVNKENVWPRPDYAKMIEGGMEPVAARLIKKIYDGLSRNPRNDNAKGRENFITMMSVVRKYAENAKTVEDVQNLAKNVRSELGVGYGMSASLTPEQKAAREINFSVYKGTQDPLVIKWRDVSKAKSEVSQGWPTPDKKDAWERAYKIIQTGYGYSVIRNGATRGTDYFTTREAAEDYAKQQYEKNKNEKGRVLPERPHLDDVKRSGKDVRIDRDVNSQDFVNDFGFRGIEFGNYVASDERQKVVNLAYDALMDLADVVGIPPKALSLNGTMGIAFGARGSGRFAAHYEPGKLVINMTKLSGAGSLAHEWAHALDHYLGELDTATAYQGKAKGASGWLERPSFFDTKNGTRLKNLRPELSKAFEGVMESLFHTKEDQAEAVRHSELMLEKYEALIKEASSSGKSPAYIEATREQIKSLKEHLSNLRGENPPLRLVASSFSREANKLSGKTGDYWKRPTEMFARSFESFVFDKIAERGDQSDYLVHGVEPDRYEGESYKGNPYPTGKEREAINAAFQNLIDTFKLRKGKGGPDTALYSVGQSAGMTADALRDTLTRGKDGGFVKALIDAGRVVLHDTAKTAPGFSTQRGPVQAAVTPDGTMHFVAGNLDASTARGVLLHEAFHSGGQSLMGEKVWRNLLNRIGQMARNSNPREGGWLAAAKARAEAAGTPRQYMAEEIAAYAIEDSVNAPAGIREIADRLVGAFKAWVLRRFGKQLGAVTPGQLRSLAVLALRARRNESNPATTGGGERFSVENAQSGEEGGYLGDAQRAAIDEILAGKKRGAPVVFQKVPLVLEALGVKQTPVAVPQPVIWKAVNKHGMTPDKIKAALDGIANPVMVFDSDTTPGSFVILVNVPGESRPVVVAAHTDENIGRIEITRIASIHRKDSGQSVIKWWNDGLTRYFNKTKAGEWVRSRGLYLPKDGSPKHRLGLKILQHSDVFKGGSGIRYSIGSTAGAAVKNKSVVQRANEAASDFLTSAMVGGGWKPGQFSSLALAPVRALFTELAEGMPSAQGYLDTKQEMDSFRNEMNTADDALLQDWLKWGRKNKDANSRLMDVMHDSTLVQYDPTLTDAEAKSKGQTVDRGVKAAYAALPAEAKEFYAKIRDAYAQRSKDVEDQVVANVKKALTMILRNAQRAYDAEIERIKDDGLTGKAKADAEKAAQDKLKMAQTRLARNKAARIKRMRQYFESNRLKGPYFPLARFGNYFVTLRDADGKVLSFEKFSGRSAQRARAEELRGLYGIDAVQESTAQYEEKGARAVDPGFLASVDTILDEAGVDMGVRDAIYQTYLETMPDLSMRKASIHRKGTAGFDADAVRGFAHNMFHSAHQLSRLRYGMDLQDHLAEAAKQVRNSADPVRTQAVYNEMAKSHQFTMNPEGSPMAHYVTSGVFLWTMAFNLSTAMVNTLQSVNVGIPNIAYDVDTSGKAGIRMASKAMAQAAVDFVRGKGTVLDSDKLTTDERAAVNAAYASGLIDSTQAHDLAGVAESGVNYRPGWQRFMRAASAPMHQTERFNREITFLAAYRVSRKAGLDHVAAVKKAEDQTWKTHFDNQSTSKPRFARGELGKMLFALKSYQANFVFRIFRDLHQALQGKTETERKTAIKRFTSMFLLTSAAAGVRGAFFYSTVMAIAGAFMGLAGKDDDDPDEIVRKFVIESIPDAIVGHAVSGMILDGIPGYFTGTSLTNRVGMQDMWFRTSDRDNQNWGDWLADQIAPIGILNQLKRGVDDIVEGNVERGVEKMLPSAAFFGAGRNVAKAARYAKEGAQDKYGNPIVDNVPWRDVFKQALGFTPAEIADRFARNTYQNNIQNRIEEKASDARKAVARAMIAGDRAAEDKARAAVDSFNDRYPEYQILPNSIMQSMRNMERRSGRMENGVELNPKLRDRIERGTAPSIYAR